MAAEVVPETRAPARVVVRSAASLGVLVLLNVLQRRSGGEVHAR